MGADLLLGASETPGIIDGWAGPVVVTGDSGLTAGSYGVVVLLGTVPGEGGGLVGYSELFGICVFQPEHLSLDLSRAECRWRVDCWIAHAVLDADPHATSEPGPRTPLFWFNWEMPYRSRSLSRVYRRITIGRGRCWADREVDSVPVLPGLDGIDPYTGPSPGPRDDRRLPDGSRWSDAAARVLLARHLGLAVPRG